MHYEVQYNTLLFGWANTWVYDDGDGLQRETFASREAAEAALDEYLEDLEEEFHAGHTGPFDRRNFRVRQVETATHSEP